MQLCKISNQSLIGVNEKEFANEEELHALVEENFTGIFPGLELVSRKFKVSPENEIDTFAYDAKAKSFVVVEYKPQSSKDLVHQVNRYLNAVKENKADCIVEYQEKFGRQLRLSDVEWNKVRAICVAPSFDPKLIKSVNNGGVYKRWQLRQVNRFEGDLITLAQIAPPPDKPVSPISPQPTSKKRGTSRPSPNPVFPSSTDPTHISSEEERHVGKLDSALQPMWFELRKKLSGWAGASFDVKKQYISFRKQGKVACYINFQKTGLKITIHRGTRPRDGRNFFTMSDPKRICKESEWKKQNGDRGFEYVWSVSDAKDLNYTIRLIKQKYDHLDQIQKKVLLKAGILPEEENLVGKLDPALQSMWFELRKKLSGWAGASFNVNKHYISFRKQGKVACYINFQKTGLKITIHRGTQLPGGQRSGNFFTMSDPKRICKEREWKKQNGDRGFEYVWSVSDTKDLNYTIQLIKQKYDRLGQSKRNALSKVNISPEEKQLVSKLDVTAQSVWFKLREKLSRFPNTDFHPTKNYLGFRKQGNVVCYINFHKTKLQISVLRGIRKPDGQQSKNFFTLHGGPKEGCEESSWEYRKGVQKGTKGFTYVWFMPDTKLNDTVRLLKQKYDHI